MNPQEAYNEIREYFTRPDAQLSRQGYTCFYRHPEDGRKCAVGAVLTDEEHAAMLAEKQAQIREAYPDKLEYTATLSGTVGLIKGLNSFPSRLLDGTTLRFLDRAQLEHDTAQSVTEFVNKLDKIANEAGLKVAA